jgi:D-alanyl-D-alanine carboxypeptidase
MNDEESFIPPTIDDAQKARRFPVVAQLSLLGGILAIIFSAVIIPQAFSKKTGGGDTWVETTAPISDSTILNTTAIQAIDPVSITAKAAYVYDVKAKRALYNKEADMVLPLASITKLMTSLIATELIDGTTTVKIPKAAVQQDGASGLREGEQISSRSLTDYSVIASSNDAAFALGAAVGKAIGGTDPNSVFTQSMNIRAEQLKLSSMKFYNPTGLDISVTEAGAYGSARDVTFLMEYILDNYPDLLNPTTETSVKIYSEDGAYYLAENTDPVISKIPNLLASKTGYTDLAGGNLTIAFDAGFNRPIIITVLGSSFSGRFNDVLILTKAVQDAFANTDSN